MKLLLDEMSRRVVGVNGFEGDGVDDFDDFNTLLHRLQAKLARTKPKLITHDILRQVLKEEQEAASSTAFVGQQQREPGKVVDDDDFDLDQSKDGTCGDAEMENAEDSDKMDADREVNEDSREEIDEYQRNHAKSKTRSSFFHPKTQKKTKMMPSSSLKTNAPSSSTPSSSLSSSWTMLSAFTNTPKLTFDSMRQQFSYDDNSVLDTKTGTVSPAPLMGTARDKLFMMTQRFKLIQQRTARSRQRSHQKYITTIDRLLGHSNAADHGRAVVLLGILHQSSEVHVTGCYLELEDLTGTIPLQLTATTYIDPTGMYLEGTTVVVYGLHDNGVFHCNKIELPPLEKPTMTRPQLPPAPTRIQTMKAPSYTPGCDIKIWSISNVIIDDPAGVSRLEALIQRITEHDDEETMKNDSTIPDRRSSNIKKPRCEKLLVLFGNFTTDPTTLSADLDELGRMLHSLPPSTTVFVVPGPADVVGTVWPLPAFSQRTCPGLHRMPNVHMCTNPCRLELPGGHQVLLTRKDVIRESLPKQILSTPSQITGDYVEDDDKNDDVKDDSGSDEKIGLITDAWKVPLVGCVLSHALSQGHIMPQSPVYWNYDHVMHMYPLPDIMLFSMDADSDEGDTIVFHPVEEELDNPTEAQKSKGESTIIVPCLDKSVVITLKEDDDEKSTMDDELFSGINLSLEENCMDENEKKKKKVVRVPLVHWKHESSFVMTVDQVDLTENDGN
jgi:hypothetical protein